MKQAILRDPQALPEPSTLSWLFHDNRFAPWWLVARLYLAWVWLNGAWDKLTDTDGAWVGAKSGQALTAFVQYALLHKTTGPYPDIAQWYGTFLREAVLPHAAFFSYLVTFGELLVGMALLLGLFTGVAAFFGGFMNLAFLFAGTVSVNPMMFVLATGLVMAWRIAGEWGVDHWLLPRMGVPGAPGPWTRNLIEPLADST